MRAWTVAGLAILMCTAGCASLPASKPEDPRLARAEADNARVEKLVEDMDFERAGPEAERVAAWIEAELGPTHPAYAEALSNQGALRYYRQDIAGAKALFERALAIQDAALPKQHPDRADSLANLGAIAMAEQDHAKARALYTEALAIRTEALGPEHPDVGDALHELAYPLLLDGEHERALELYRRALAIWEKALGPTDRRTGQGHLSLGMALAKLGRTEEANREYEQALAVFDKALPELHPQRFQVLQAVAMARWQAGRYSEARPLFEKLLAIQVKQLGPEDPRLADLLDRMGGVRAFTGDYRGAAELHRRALALREKAHGPDHPAAAGSLYLLANQQLALGQLDEGAVSYGRARRIYAAASGEDSLEVAYCDFGLGRIQSERGDYSGALKAYEQSIAVMEARLGADHQEVINTKITLGATYSIVGQLAKARQILEACLAAQERTLGANHPAVGRTLISLGQVARQMGNADLASAHWTRAMKIIQTAFGYDHPDVADIIGYLAESTMLAGDLQGAVDLYQEALALNEKLLGKDHPKLVTLRHNQAHVLAKAQMYDRAIEDYTYAIEHFGTGGVKIHPWVAQARCVRALVKTFADRSEEALPECTRGLTDLEASLGPAHPWIADNLRCAILANWRLGKLSAAKAAAEKSLRIARTSIYPMLQDTSEAERMHVVGKRLMFLFDYLSLATGAGAEARRAYDAVLDWKGRVAESLAVQNATLRRVGEPAVQDLLAHLARLRKNLSAMVFAGPPQDQTGRVAWMDEMVSLTKERDRIEREVARKSADYRRVTEERDADSATVCRRLGRGEALVDFLWHFRYTPPAAGEKSEGTRRAEYLAFVLRAGECQAPIRIDLGPAEEIDEAIAHYRELITRGAGVSRLMRQGRRLRAMIWDPVTDAVSGRRRIWIVPDAAIGELAFGSLVDDEGRFLIESLTFSYLASARELIRLSRPDEAKARGLLVAGGIDYGQAQGASQAEPAGQTRGGLLPVPPLPESQREVIEIARRLKRAKGMKVLSLTGAAATEEAVKRSMHGRRIVHLATHGFFADSLPADVTWTDSFGKLVVSYTQTSNFMALSGVALANANVSDGAPGADDGLLSAAEVASMDLAGTQLVTLSACESGRGGIFIGEGVMGLRRAFSLAGARALLVSLWKVRDAETRELMAAFYRRLVADRKGDKAGALRAAKLELIERLRTDQGRADPRLWAAFILSGR